MDIHREICSRCMDIIQSIIEKQRGTIALTEISEKSRLKEDLHLDSLLLLVLQVELEDEFKFRIDPYRDDMEEIFESVGTVCNYVEKQIGSTYEQ